MTDGRVINDHEPGLAACRHEFNTRFAEAGLLMRSRHETSGAVLHPELVDHEDEPDHRPPLGILQIVHMQFLSGLPGKQRSTGHTAELEGLPDCLITGVKY